MTEIHQEIEIQSEVQNPNKKLVDDIRSTISSLGPPLSFECCIYRVPKKLRDLNPTAYTPQVVSVGPLHHGQEALRKMETEKLRYLQHFLAKVERALSLDDLVSYIREKETRIRECYAESIDYLSSDEFVKMVLVDSAFIIILFKRDFEEQVLVDYDKYLILDTPRMRYDLLEDLALLENQLPFFILKDLYDHAFSSYQEQAKHFPSFADLTLGFFSYHNQQNKRFAEHTKHFTDLLRYFHHPLPSSTNTSSPTYFSNCCNHYKSFPRKVKNFIQPLTSFLHLNQKLENKNEDEELLYCAVELHAAGVEFEVSQSKCLLDVQFSNGKLVMPFFRLEDYTEIRIRNIMALEQCHCIGNAKICNYIILMDYLINTAKDVELLIQKKIMVNRLGDNQTAANLFNKLGLQIFENKNLYGDIFRRLNEYYEVRCHRWKATLRQVYFRTPFRVASAFAAIILLVLTLLQTVFSGIALRPSKN